MSAEPTPGASRRSWGREPLLHFLVLGGLVFAGHRLLFTPGPTQTVSAEDAPTAQLFADYQAFAGQAPDTEQKQVLVAEWLDEEVLYRRALELGLDQNDTIVRRRLVQRMRFVLEDTDTVEGPSTDQLQAWLDAHPDRYQTSATASFEQVFFSRGRRGSQIEQDAARAAKALRASPEVVVEGDPFFRGRKFENATAGQLKREFGGGFVKALTKLPVGEWAGPVQSSYGLHLVRLGARSQGVAPPLAAVRTQVSRDWTDAERARLNRASVDALRQRYATRNSEAGE